MKDYYTKKMFAKEIKKFCTEQGYYPVMVGKEVFQIFLEHAGEYDSQLREKMIDIFTMEEGLEFVMTEEEFYQFLDEM